MSRKIKLRVWDGLQMIYPIGDEKNNCTLTSGDLLCRFDNEKLVQYIGENDKNGIEIYDGDIVKDRYGNLHLVQFAGFMVYPFIEGSEYQNECLPNQCDIIGNKFENPEISDPLYNIEQETEKRRIEIAAIKNVKSIEEWSDEMPF